LHEDGNEEITLGNLLAPDGDVASVDASVDSENEGTPFCNPIIVAVQDYSSKGSHFSAHSS
jgi:hypothetical protein